MAVKMMDVQATGGATALRLRSAAGVVALMTATACGVTPRIPIEVASSLAANPMDTLETPELVVYFPRQRRDEALRFVEHTRPCIAALRARQQIHNGLADDKMRVVLPELPYNNADVNGRAAGLETLAVIGTYGTAEIASEIGQPLDPGITGCHELTHYVQSEQIGGFWRGVNGVLGPLFTPQRGLDVWFWEGLATYYETAMQPGIGRMAWPFWHGLFAAGVAGRRLNGGDLSDLKRGNKVGNHYLIGSHFIRFLVERYGEEKLWRLIAVQGRSIFFAFGVNVRFWQVYDKSLSTLIDEFAEDVAARTPARARPPEQRSLFQSGIAARYARALDGTQALMDQALDQPTRLRILDAAGNVRAEHALIDVLPPRRLDKADPRLASGLSFTADGRSLFFVVVDRGPVYQRSRLLRYDLATDKISLVAGDIGGPGGAVSPDGKRYWFSRADGDRWDLAEVDVASGAIRVVQAMPAGSYVLGPHVSPDGKQVVASVFERGRYGLALFDGTTGRRGRTLPTGAGPAIDPSFVDANRIVYLSAPAASDGAHRGDGLEDGFQVYLLDLITGQSAPVTRAPYLAFQPQAGNGSSLRFLNREGWTWTIDEVDLPPAPATAPTEPTPSPSPAATPPPDTDRPAPAPPMSSPAVASERPYRSWTSALVPRLIEPGILLDPGSPQLNGGRFVIGLTLMGYDHLQFHLWTASVARELGSGLWSYHLRYINRLLAPYVVTLDAFQTRQRTAPEAAPGAPPQPDDGPTVYRRDSVVTADLSRAFYDNPVSLGGQLVESYRPDDPNVPLALTRVAGPFVSFSYAGLETTPYAGTRRAIIAEGRAAYYPRAWSANDLQFADLRGRLSLVTPLPLLRRQSFTVDGVIRALPGAPNDQPLLQIGGMQPFLRTFLNREVGEPAPGSLPPQGRLVEPLRGFEDLVLAGNTLLAGAATYRYPFIVDRGAASAAGIFPSIFWRELDLELFGQLAQTRLGDQHSLHAAVGGALSASLRSGFAPMTLTYQLSRRLTDDRLWSHVLGLVFQIE